MAEQRSDGDVDGQRFLKHWITADICASEPNRIVLDSATNSEVGLGPSGIDAQDLSDTYKVHFGCIAASIASREEYVDLHPLIGQQKLRRDKAHFVAADILRDAFDELRTAVPCKLERQPQR